MIFHNSPLPFPFLFLLGILVSCQSPTRLPFFQQPTIPGDLQEKLSQAQNSNADTAIYYANIILDYIRDNELPDSLYITYNAIKAFQLVKTTQQEEALEAFSDNYLTASALGDSLLIARTAMDLAEFYNIIFQQALALPYATAAVNYYKSHEVNVEAARSLSNLGWVHLDGGDFFQALEYFKLVENIYAANKDTLNLAFTLADIGYTMIKLGIPDAALNATQKGIQLVENLPNGESVGIVLGNLALNYKESHPDSAIYYQQKAIDLSSALGDSLNWVASLYNLGNSLKRMDRLEEAEKIYLQVYEFCTANSIHQGIIRSYNALGALYLQTREFDKSLHYSMLADHELRKTGSPVNLLLNLENLISAHTQLGNLNQVQNYQRTRDSLQHQMQLQQTQNTTKYVEQAIASERAAYENQLLRKSAQSAGEKVKQREITLYALFTIFVFAFAIGILWRRTHLAAQQTTQVLLNRYAAEIQSKKTNHLTQEDKGAFFIQIARQFRELMDQQKLYLQSGLKAEDILEHLNISYNDLNQLLKAEFQSSFPQVINQYRVQEAKKYLSDPNNNLPLDQIANLAGFRTRQNFYKTFHAQTGVSPGAFRAYLFTNKQN